LRIFLTASTLLLLTILVWCTSACDTERQGRQLAENYCGSCHLFPEPNLLDKKTWREGVLPEMAVRMGMAEPDLSIFEPEEYQRILEQGGLPVRPLLNRKDWEKILDYYEKNAPEQVPSSSTNLAINVDSSLFHSEILWQTPGQSPNFSLLKYLPNQQTLFAGQREGKIYSFSERLINLQDSLFVPSTPSDIDEMENGQLELLLMGKMDPNDWFNGQWIEIKKEQKKWKLLKQWQRELNRPVQFSAADFNADGQKDWLICEFGHYLGKLAWYEKNAGTGMKIHMLLSTSGTRVAQIVDLDQDGDQDIVALLTQGDEQIIWFNNQGKGEFERIQVARFPPVYGSSYLEVKDIDRDGHIDLIHSCGDNYDYSYSLKSYHGVRIFLNQGQEKFKESKFLPLHGAGKVLVEDFDQDGLQDIACTAYFPDYQQKPLRGFVLYRNAGNLNFKANTFPKCDMANWLLMDKGDFDQDGDIDLVLGACSINNTVSPSLRSKWTKLGLGLLLLRNQSVP
jgi:hypothetical protein